MPLASRTNSVSRSPQPVLRCAAAFVSAVVLAGCQTRGTPGTVEKQPVAATQLLLLNTQEASGWAGYASLSTNSSESLADYRVQISEVETGAVIYESIVLMPSDIKAHAFELAPDDPLLDSISSTVDREILAKLEPELTHPTTGEPLTGLEAVQITKWGEELLYLDQGNQDFLQLGQRFYLRTPEKRTLNPLTNEQIIISGGRITALLEISKIEDNKAEAKLLTGSIRMDATLEAAD